MYMYEVSGLNNINNNNIYIVVYSQHPYCCVNSIILTLFLKESEIDVRICSPQFVPFA